MKFQKNNPFNNKQGGFRGEHIFFHWMILVNTILSLMFQGCHDHRSIVSHDISIALKKEIITSLENQEGLNSFRNLVLGVKPLPEELKKFPAKSNMEIYRLQFAPPFGTEMMFTIYISEQNSWIETRYANDVLSSIYTDYQMGLDWEKEMESIQIFVETCLLNPTPFKKKIKEMNLFEFPSFTEIGQRPFVTDGDVYYHFSIRKDAYHHFQFLEPEKGLSKYDDMFLELVATYLKARKCRL